MKDKMNDSERSKRERTYIGRMIVDKDCLKKGVNIQPIFTSRKHCMVYGAIRKLYNSGKKVSLINVVSELKDDNDICKCFIDEICLESVINPIMFDECVKTVTGG